MKFDIGEKLVTCSLEKLVNNRNFISLRFQIYISKYNLHLTASVQHQLFMLTKKEIYLGFKINFKYNTIVEDKMNDIINQFMKNDFEKIELVLIKMQLLYNL